MKKEYEKFLWKKGDFTLRESDVEPTPEEVAHGQKVLDEVIDEFKKEFEKRRSIWDPPV